MVFMPHWPKNIRRDILTNNLDIIKEILKKLGNPHLSIPPVLHITGTNGKGSVAAYLFSILSDAGYKAHLYTSPHLINVNERIVLANHKISDGFLYECLEEVRVATGDTRLFFFEAITIAAFVAFSKIHADILIMEVGMGGEFDATNVIENTMISILTKISLDHVDYLGNTPEMIATTKCGIMRTGVPCVVGHQNPSVLRAIEQMSIKNKTPLFRGGFEWRYDYDEKRLFFFSKNNSLTLPYPNLRGKHQLYNASIAIAAVSLLNNNLNFNIYFENITNGLLNVFWPARIMPVLNRNVLDILSKEKLWDVFIDGAHNRDGANALAQWIKEKSVKKPCYAIIGLTKNKDICAFLSEFIDVVDFVCCVCVRSETNAYLATEIAACCEKVGIKYFIAESVRDALQIVSANASASGTVVITGSLYLTKDVYLIETGCE